MINVEDASMGVTVELSTSMSASGGSEVAVEDGDCEGRGIVLRDELGVRNGRRKKVRIFSILLWRGRSQTNEDDATGGLGIVGIGAATMVVVGKEERNAPQDTACQPRGRDVAQLLDIAEWQAARSAGY